MLSGLQQIIIDVISTGLTIAALAMGFLLFLRSTGVFNVGYGVIVIGAGYVFGGLFATAGMPPALAFAGAAVAAALVSVLLAAGFRLIGGGEHHGAADRALITSVGIALVLEHVLALAFGTDVWSVSTSLVSRGYSVPPVAFLAGMFILMVATYAAFRKVDWRLVAGTIILEVCLTVLALTRAQSGIMPRGRLLEALISLCCLASAAAYLRSRQGLRLHAFLSSPVTARLLGFNTKRYGLYCVMAAGVSSGLVSAARVMNVGVRPDESWRVLVAASFVALLADRVSAPLLAVVGIAYALASYLAVLAFSSTWRDAISFALLFLIIAFGPERQDAETAPSEV